jgi:hypothetical protein
MVLVLARDLIAARDLFSGLQHRPVYFRFLLEQAGVLYEM